MIRPEQGMQAQARTVNGVPVDKLFQSIETVKATPGLGRFRFRIRNEWMDGGHNQSFVNNYYGLGTDKSREQPFILEADEPPALLGKDLAANPVEHLLHALAACVTSSMVYHAAARGIRLDEVESELEGDIDLRGFLGLDPSVRRGYQGIRIKFRIKADVPDDELQELVALGPRYSPVFDSVMNGVPIQVTGERL